MYSFNLAPIEELDSFIQELESKDDLFTLELAAIIWNETLQGSHLHKSVAFLLLGITYPISDTAIFYLLHDLINCTNLSRQKADVLAIKNIAAGLAELGRNSKP